MNAPDYLRGRELERLLGHVLILGPGLDSRSSQRLDLS
jgi:hypothetical protein